MEIKTTPHEMIKNIPFIILAILNIAIAGYLLIKKPWHSEARKQADITMKALENGDIHSNPKNGYVVDEKDLLTFELSENYNNRSHQPIREWGRNDLHKKDFATLKNISNWRCTGDEYHVPEIIWGRVDVSEEVYYSEEDYRSEYKTYEDFINGMIASHSQYERPEYIVSKGARDTVKQIFYLDKALNTVQFVYDVRTNDGISRNVVLIMVELKEKFSHHTYWKCGKIEIGNPG